MRVVIAGGGDLTRYLCEEFPRAGHEVVVLTRKPKPYLDGPGITQFTTDYTLPSLSLALADGQVLISTIADLDPSSHIAVHRTLIQACQASPNCKRFIPSEYAGNVETYPDQPGFYYRTRAPVRDLLQAQSDLEWTVISLGWFADYLTPTSNRYIKDIGECCPINLTKGEIVIPGTGTEPFDFTWVRDVARALAELVKAPQWERHTYMSGERTCWNEAVEVARAKYPSLPPPRYVSYYDIAETIRADKDDDSRFVCDHWLFTVSQASSMPGDKVRMHRQKYFPDLTFRTLREGLAHFEPGSGMIM